MFEKQEVQVGVGTQDVFKSIPEGIRLRRSGLQPKRGDLPWWRREAPPRGYSVPRTCTLTRANHPWSKSQSLMQAPFSRYLGYGTTGERAGSRVVTASQTRGVKLRNVPLVPTGDPSPFSHAGKGRPSGQQKSSCRNRREKRARLGDCPHV
jgi:hypothetical protein